MFGAAALLQTLGNRVLRISSSFSGLGTDIVAAECITRAAENLPGIRSPIKVEHQWAIEVSHACQEELLLQDQDMCVFGDMTQFLPQATQKKLKEKRSVTPPSEIEELIMSSAPRSSAFCIRHGHVCSMARAHVTIAGSPCVDHSAYGKGLRDSGDHIHLFWIWALMRRHMQEVIWIHENVCQFGVDSLIRLLGDLYIIIRTTHDPVENGWPTTRKRQYVFGVLKVWAFAALRQQGMPQTVASACEAFDFERALRVLFARRCQTDLSAYMIATAEERKHMLEWAAGRPGVRKRRQLPEDP